MWTVPFGVKLQVLDLGECQVLGFSTFWNIGFGVTRLQLGICKIWVVGRICTTLLETVQLLVVSVSLLSSSGKMWVGCEKLLLPFEGGLGLLSDAFLFGFSVLSNQYGLDVVLQVGERGWNCTPCLVV